LDPNPRPRIRHNPGPICSLGKRSTVTNTKYPRSDPRRRITIQGPRAVFYPYTDPSWCVSPGTAAPIFFLTAARTAARAHPTASPSVRATLPAMENCFRGKATTTAYLLPFTLSRLPQAEHPWQSAIITAASLAKLAHRARDYIPVVTTRSLHDN
jgi:hypothetical protein